MRATGPIVSPEDCRVLLDRSSSRRNRLTTGRLGAALFVAAYLALQVGVPTARLFAPRPARFGWQMFAAAPRSPLVVATRVDGRRDTLDVDAYFAFQRGDLSRSAYGKLWPHICRVDPTAARLTVRWPGSATPPESHQCRPPER
jgi:hypothetical protein